MELENYAKEGNSFGGRKNCKANPSSRQKAREYYGREQQNEAVANAEISDLVTSALGSPSTPADVAEEILFSMICSLEKDDVLDLISLMYLGRDFRKYSPGTEIPSYMTEEEFLSESNAAICSGLEAFHLMRKHLSHLGDDNSIRADQMCGKVQFAKYLQHGLELIKESKVVG